MKAILLAAAAVIAMPAIAQTSGSTGTSSPTSSGAGTTSMGSPGGDSMASPQSMDQSTSGQSMSGESMSGQSTSGQTMSDPSMSQSTSSNGSMTSGSSSMNSGSGSMTSGSGSMAGDPVGGYQPSQPPMASGGQPGGTVQFQQAASPDQAYPAPAPLAKYPVCKRGQYDKCIQRGGR